MVVCACVCSPIHTNCRYYAKQLETVKESVEPVKKRYGALAVDDVSRTIEKKSVNINLSYFLTGPNQEDSSDSSD